MVLSNKKSVMLTGKNSRLTDGPAQMVQATQEKNTWLQ